MGGPRVRRVKSQGAAGKGLRGTAARAMTGANNDLTTWLECGNYGVIMNRRSFVKNSLAASVVVGTVPLASAGAAQGQPGGGKQQYLELRRFVVKSKAKRDFVTAFLQSAAIPALNRQGIKPLGVFYEMPESEDYSIYTLVPFASLDQFGSVFRALAEDDGFVAAASDYLHTEKADPAYEQMESTLMLAFAGYPQVKVPRVGERMFELRIYQSHNELKAFLKIEMFNNAELDIFAKVGLESVFFGQSLVGPNLPNLTYMLAFKDKAEREKIWGEFGKHPDWVELRGRERYKDTVSKITQKFLVPAACSQI